MLFVSVGTNFSRQIREGLTVEVLMNDSTRNADLLKTQDLLRHAPYTRMVDFISKERGTREMNAALQGDMCEFVGGSPIPAEFEVYLKADYANIDSIAHYEKSMRAMPGVTDVIYPRDVMESLDRTIPVVGIILLAIAALLALVSFSLIGNTLRMSIYARRYSIHTMKLVGASWGFIRRPFIWQAFRIGLVAAILAGGVLAGMMYWLQYMAGMGDVYLNELVTPDVWIVTLGTIFVCGIVLTVWCAYISVNRQLNLHSADVYLK